MAEPRQTTDEAMAALQEELRETPYRLERRLGAGAMGEVYAARHARINRPVVVKVIRGQLPPHLHDRMRLEAQLLGRFRHENIVEILDFALTLEDRPYIVMELLSGVTLDVLVKEDRALSIPHAIDIVRQTLAGLELIHQAGVVHRDIKPSNLFVCKPSDRVKLLDFGISKLLVNDLTGVDPLKQPTRSGAALGTPRFMSPEQARGKAVDARSDLYAAGMLLYRLVAGRTAFEHHHEMTAMMHAHVAEAPEPPSKFAPQPIPPALDRLVLRAIAKNPNDRFQSAREMLQALAAFEAGTSFAQPRAPSVDTASTVPAPAPKPLVDPTESMSSPPVPASLSAHDASTFNPVAATQMEPDQRKKLFALFAASFVGFMAVGYILSLLW